MRVDWLSLENFRSYKSLDWAPDPGVNLLVGANGAGKTNLLEAIGYLATLRSFRSVHEKAMVSEGSGPAILRSGLTSEGRERLIEIEIPEQGQRRAQVDKSRLQRASDLLGVVRVTAFLPEDLDVVKRGPAYRRDLLDAIAVQLWPAAHLDQAEFDRSVRQRNAFLKSGVRDDSTLSVWDSRMAQTGGRVIARRARVIETINPYLTTAYAAIADREDPAAITYVPSWSESIDSLSAADYSEVLGEALAAARVSDYERRVTTVGPHRDEPGFAIANHDARIHSSQGEQRTVALSVKLAAHRAVAETVDESPVLLLDDVFSELDPERSAALARSLPDDTQTMITSARPEDIPVQGAHWEVREGTVI